MNRLTEQLMPSLEELNQLFSDATGAPETLDERDRLMLLMWESKVREGVLTRLPSPIGEPHRWRLPDERQGMTHRFQMTDEDGRPLKAYLTTGLYSDGRLGEIFCVVAKEGTFVSGIMDALTYSMSVALQHGVPLEVFTRRFKYSKFDPSGMVQGAPSALRGFFGSVLDYIGRYLELRFPNGAFAEPEELVPSAELQNG